ncbi:MAG: hypothetical protein U0235_19325 [Polyangiaceae bacterium]
MRTSTPSTATVVPTSRFMIARENKGGTQGMTDVASARLPMMAHACRGAAGHSPSVAHVVITVSPVVQPVVGTLRAPARGGGCDGEDRCEED